MEEARLIQRTLEALYAAGALNGELRFVLGNIGTEGLEQCYDHLQSFSVGTTTLSTCCTFWPLR